MSSERKDWENLKAEYLKEAEKALSSVKHPHMAEVLQDVRSHLDQRFAELESDEQTHENLRSIITEMGPASDYAELLSPDAGPRSQRVQRKYLRWIGLLAVVIGGAIILSMAVFPKADSLAKTKWNCLPLLDFGTRTALGSFEMYYEEEYHKATGYDAVSQKQKDAMVEQWIQEIQGLDYEKAVLATAALGDARAQKAVAVLTEVATTEDGDNRIKWIAVRGLAKIADRDTVPVLITLIDHYNQNVRTYAKVALAEITGQFFGDSKDRWHKWWQENKNNESTNARRRQKDEKGNMLNCGSTNCNNGYNFCGTNHLC
ncbi:MAG: HEAT repeat domain-containing protein [Planctomycetota bacterium]